MKANLAPPDGESRLWGAVVSAVVRRPLVSVAVAAAGLLALAAPALGMHTRLLGYTDLPQSLPVIGTYKRIQQAFPGAQTPAEVIIRAKQVTVPRVESAARDSLRIATSTPPRAINASKMRPSCG